MRPFISFIQGRQRAALASCSLTTGILGGYTTFSAFSLDTVLLYDNVLPKSALAALYVIASIVLSIGGLFLGLAVMAVSWPVTAPSGAASLSSSLMSRSRSGFGVVRSFGP